MAYEIEWWESDRALKPTGGGESREHVVRVANLAAARGLTLEPRRYTVRITLSDTRGRIWDLWRAAGTARDRELDSELRDLSDQRPAGAAVPRAKKRG